MAQGDVWHTVDASKLPDDLPVALVYLLIVAGYSVVTSDRRSSDKIDRPLAMQRWRIVRLVDREGA